jgi:hypothetical protein
MDQVYLKYTKFKTVPNLPKFGFLVWKQTIWQPCCSPQQPSVNMFPPLASYKTVSIIDTQRRLTAFKISVVDS